LAISVDHIYSHQVFSASLGTLPFPLLADWHKKTAKCYHVYNTEREAAVRSVFLVNKQGILTFINTQFDARNRAHYLQIFVELEKMN
jgi:alkyl hydroperoxide reductase subunit AhpC